MISNCKFLGSRNPFSDEKMRCMYSVKHAGCILAQNIENWHITYQNICFWGQIIYPILELNMRCMLSVKHSGCILPQKLKFECYISKYMFLGSENSFIGLKMGCMEFLFSKLDSCWLKKPKIDTSDTYFWGQKIHSKYLYN